MRRFAEVHRPAAATGAPAVLLLHGGNVSSWMWEPQVAELADRIVVTPDLPGFGEHADQVWPGLPAVVDHLAHRLSELGVPTPVDVVGLSLGGAVALQLAARRPELVRSLLVSGALVAPPGAGVRAAARLQLLLWDAPWFWRAQAAAFRLPAESRRVYVEDGLSVSRETARGMFRDVIAGGVPPGLAEVTAPVLAVVGEREARSVRASLQAVRAVVPHTEVRLAPGMHHIWNVEDVDLFNQTTRHWLGGQVHPRLLPV